MIALRLSIICAALLTAIPAISQNQQLRRNQGGQQSGRDMETGKNQNDTVRPGSAWTLTFPLGNHVESTLDTLTYNFQRRTIPTMVTDAYATTGNYGTEGIDLIYYNRPRRATFFFQWWCCPPCWPP